MPGSNLNGWVSDPSKGHMSESEQHLNDLFKKTRKVTSKNVAPKLPKNINLSVLSTKTIPAKPASARSSTAPPPVRPRKSPPSDSDFMKRNRQRSSRRTKTKRKEMKLTKQNIQDLHQTAETSPTKVPQMLKVYVRNAATRKELMSKAMKSKKLSCVKYNRYDTIVSSLHGIPKTSELQKYEKLGFDVGEDIGEDEEMYRILQSPPMSSQRPPRTATITLDYGTRDGKTRNSQHQQRFNELQIRSRSLSDVHLRSKKQTSSSSHLRRSYTAKNASHIGKDSKQQSSRYSNECRVPLRVAMENVDRTNIHTPKTNAIVKSVLTMGQSSISQTQSPKTKNDTRSYTLYAGRGTAVSRTQRPLIRKPEKHLTSKQVELKLTKLMEKIGSSIR